MRTRPSPRPAARPTSHAPSASHRLYRRIEDNISQGVNPGGQDLLRLAGQTLDELPQGIADRELAEILRFLLMCRVTFERSDEARFGEAVEQLARELAQRLPQDGEIPWSPFMRRGTTTARELRGQFYRTALGAGQIDASLVFA